MEEHWLDTWHVHFMSYKKKVDKALEMHQATSERARKLMQRIDELQSKVRAFREQREKESD